MVWAVSEADRIYAKEITIGRTLGSSIEVYEGLKKGDRYIANPTSDIKENMFIDAISVPATSTPAKLDEHANMPGM